MTYIISKPSTFLDKFVQHYWTIENCNCCGTEHIQRVVPNGLLEIIFYFGNRPNSINSQKQITGNAIISGQLKDYYDIRFTGSFSLFSILFKPHGLSMFTNIPINEFYNQNIPLEFVFPNEFNKLEDSISTVSSFTERILIVEDFLFKQLLKNKNNENLNRIESCVNIINHSKGVVDIDYLASEACFSRKQFERTFSHYIGASPKQLLKTVRFQNALNEKSKHKSISLTELAYRCGYYDQSHMINDFQKLTGLSPKEYFNECEPYSDYFQ
ncbi:MAG: DUF6597 domain-containing transcriptional factor [Bacteroidales bacterium]